MNPTKPIKVGPDMTDADRAELCEVLWKANDANNKMLVKKLMAENSMPPVLTAFPGIDKFFMNLQKKSFFLGVLALLHQATSLDSAEQNPNKTVN